MEDPLIFIIIGFSITFIIIIGLIFFNAFAPYKAPENNITTDYQNYLIPSPWSSPPSPSSNQVNNLCNTYTYIGNTNFYPPNVKFANIITCTNINGCVGNSCTCTIKSSNSLNCIDSDQLFAKEVSHTCVAFGEGAEVPNNTNECLQTNGEIVPVGTVETYFAKCGETTSQSTQETISDINQITDNYCFGAISIFVFNMGPGTGTQVFENALCFESKNWTESNGTYLNLSPIKLNTCNTTNTYMNFPSQLFRMQRASYSGTFKQTTSGSFCRIQQRPSNYYFYPNLDTGSLSPIPLSNILLQNITDDTKTYCWYLLPNIPVQMYVTGTQTLYLSARQQLIYVPSDKASTVPASNNYFKLLQYIMTNNVYSIQPQLYIEGGKYILANNGNLILDKVLVYNNSESATSLNNSKCIACTINYLDYAILPVIIKNPDEYTFYS